MTWGRLASTLLVSALAASADDLPRQAIEILTANCQGCHGASIKLSGLDLRTADSMKKGGERGPALVPGDSSKSGLFLHAAGVRTPAMPPGKKLADWQLNVLRRWIDTGAPMPEKPVETVSANESLKKLEERPITAEERQWWAFRPISNPKPPAETKNPIDAFLQAALKAKGLKPSPAANPRMLVRRLYLDLTGLPPTPEEVAAFVKDPSAQAYEQLVEKLLASPHYGERWARHWLDLVRYADSGGYEYDRDRPQAWRYRDYIVRSFNTNKPYNQFLREQLAGDEISNRTDDSLIATTYLRLGLDANIKTEQTRLDELDDILVTTSNTMLGLTLGCARCHNHKFDPIPQKDYYRIQAVFYPSKPVEYPLVPTDVADKHKAENERIDAQIKALKKQREEIQKPTQDKLLDAKKALLPEYLQVALKTPPDQRTEGQKLNAIQIEKTLSVSEKEMKAALPSKARSEVEAIAKKIAALEKQRPAPLPAAMGIGEDSADAPPSYFLHHGSADAKGSVMAPGVLSVVAKNEPEFPKGDKSTFRRLGFANWVTSPDNPLTPRVIVNRIWQHHFGEGIVRTPSNFGKTGEAPTHPELLDYLASRFLESGWDIKAMHRLMVNSDAYKMASDDIVESMAIDPDNRLLWRMPRYRMESEALRDSMMAVAGTLDRTVGGEGVFPFIDPALWQGSSGRKWPGKLDTDPSTWRRSIYVFVKRSIPLPMLETFDRPDGISSCARRNRSVTATQSLILMNNESVHFHARKFAERLKKEAGSKPRDQVDRAFELAFNRPPSPNERDYAITFITSAKNGLDDFCHALFNTNEFAYVP